MSIEERHRLDDIERYLRQIDPSFVAMFERSSMSHGTRRAGRWRRLLRAPRTAKVAVLVAALASVAVAVTAVLGLVVATVAAAVVALTALCVAGDRSRTPAKSPVPARLPRRPR